MQGLPPCSSLTSTAVRVAAGTESSCQERPSFGHISLAPTDQMPTTSTHHGTVVVEGIIEAPASRVYAAYADSKAREAREAWERPPIRRRSITRRQTFRVGGRDVARCSPKTDPRFILESRYLEIIPEHRVVCTETIREVEKTLAANITTLELVPDARRTRLKVTVQVTSFVGDDMIANTRAGHTGSLAKMARYFDKRQTR